MTREEPGRQLPTGLLTAATVYGASFFSAAGQGRPHVGEGCPGWTETPHSAQGWVFREFFHFPELVRLTPKASLYTENVWAAGPRGSSCGRRVQATFLSQPASQTSPAPSQRLWRTPLVGLCGAGRGSGEQPLFGSCRQLCKKFRAAVSFFSNNAIALHSLAFCCVRSSPEKYQSHEALMLSSKSHMLLPSDFLVLKLKILQN